MADDILSDSQSEQIARFAEAARRYCEWVESEPGQPIEEIRIARRLLTQLHLHAIELPDIDWDKDWPEDRRISNEALIAVCRRFGGLPIQFYWQIFAPLEDAEDGGLPEPVGGELADDFSDIYRDVKEGLDLFDSGYIVGATWEWRFSFLAHWGKDLVSAQTALHEFFALHMDYQPSDESKT
ncbi:MAG TPA: DUF5063 domain-containing protein [Acidobacteriota bacterium]|nr:DUF5063 domain-containing protein [Acidobacteriota bacterium]